MTTIYTQARAMVAALQARVDVQDKLLASLELTIAGLQARIVALEARAHTNPGPHDEPPGVLVCKCGHGNGDHIAQDSAGQRGACIVGWIAGDIRDVCQCEKWRPVRREMPEKKHFEPFCVCGHIASDHREDDGTVGTCALCGCGKWQEAAVNAS